MWSALLCRGLLGGPGAGGGARYGLYPQLTMSTRLGTRSSADSVFGGKGNIRMGMCLPQERCLLGLIPGKLDRSGMWGSWTEQSLSWSLLLGIPEIQG